jgi:hypothetical protein
MSLRNLVLGKFFVIVVVGSGGAGWWWVVGGGVCVVFALWYWVFN